MTDLEKIRRLTSKVKGLEAEVERLEVIAKAAKLALEAIDIQGSGRPDDNFCDLREAASALRVALGKS